MAPRTPPPPAFEELSDTQLDDVQGGRGIFESIGYYGGFGDGAAKFGKVLDMTAAVTVGAIPGVGTVYNAVNGAVDIGTTAVDYYNGNASGAQLASAIGGAAISLVPIGGAAHALGGEIEGAAEYGIGQIVGATVIGGQEIINHNFGAEGAPSSGDLSDHGFHNASPDGTTTGSPDDLADHGFHTGSPDGTTGGAQDDVGDHGFHTGSPDGVTGGAQDDVGDHGFHNASPDGHTDTAPSADDTSDHGFHNASPDGHTDTAPAADDTSDHGFHNASPDGHTDPSGDPAAVADNSGTGGGGGGDAGGGGGDFGGGGGDYA